MKKNEISSILEKYQDISERAISERYDREAREYQRGLGLVSQEALNLVMSHINSAPVESLHGKSPIEYAKFMAPGLWKKLEEFGIKKIPYDDITLKPCLLAGFREKQKYTRANK